VSASDMASTKRRFDQGRVAYLAKATIAEMTAVHLSPLEMMAVADGIFITVASTLLEVAEPGERQEAVRKDLLGILGRMRLDIELGPNAPTTEVQ
jgi:hypothetical protein